MESLVVTYHTPFNIFFPFYFSFHMHGVRRYASIAVVFFLALYHCIVSNGSTQCTSKYLILIFYYMRDTRWPTPPASGGMGSSPLRSETNAAYLGFRKVVSQLGVRAREWKRLLTFWSSGRFRQGKRTASYSSARVGDVRHGSRATSPRKHEKKRERRGY
jgi:hypothetical protein